MAKLLNTKLPGTKDANANDKHYVMRPQNYAERILSYYIILRRKAINNYPAIVI